MKKLNSLIFIVFIFVSGDMIAQVTATGSNKLYRSAGGADRVNEEPGDPTSSNDIWATQGDWSVDLVISEHTPAEANAQGWTGVASHNGMGASGWGSFAAGAYSRASGLGAFVGGFHNVAGPTGSDTNSLDGNSVGHTAFGYGTQATGNVAFAVGEGTTASGANSTAMGENTVASGTYSTAIGYETDATDYGSLVIGQYNSSGSSATSATSFSTSAPAFVIGNGTSGNTSDAFKVVFNGNTTMAGDLTVTGNDITFGNSETISNSTDGTVAITATTTTVSGDLTVTGNDIKSSSATAITLSSDDVTIADDLTVTGDVNVSSDARLKSNIISLGSTLSKLLLIDGKSYTMIKDGDKKIGVLAQEVQKVFPELVSEDGNEMLSVNYQGLVPVLINAIKEQEDKISRLENLGNQLINQ